jgi:hypothetical protein
VSRTALFLIALTALSLPAAAEDAVPLPPDKANLPVIGGQIAVGKALPPAQKIALLEETLNRESDRRAELEKQVADLTTESNKLTSLSNSLSRERSALDAELTRTRDTLSRIQRDYESLRGDYSRIKRVASLALPIVGIVGLVLLALLTWLVILFRRQAEHVHDVPTLAQIHEAEGQLGQLQEQLKTEHRQNQALRDRLGSMGIVE